MASGLTKPHTTGSSRATRRRASERPWTCEMRSLRSAAAGNARERRPSERRKNPTSGRLRASDSTTVATAFASNRTVASNGPAGASLRRSQELPQADLYHGPRQQPVLVGYGDHHPLRRHAVLTPNQLVG